MACLVLLIRHTLDVCWGLGKGFLVWVSVYELKFAMRTWEWVFMLQVDWRLALAEVGFLVEEVENGSKPQV